MRDSQAHVETSSGRPQGRLSRTPDSVRDRIIGLRTELIARGLDAGPATITWHLGREGLPAPSTSTIRRVLHAAGLVVPEPGKRPRSSPVRSKARLGPDRERWTHRADRRQPSRAKWGAVRGGGGSGRAGPPSRNAVLTVDR
jgi:hypothetical protein